MLSELRNKVVHDVKEIGFSLPNYVSGLNASQRRQFRVKAMHWIEEEELGVYTDLCQDQPRMILWLATSALAVRGVDRPIGRQATARFTTGHSGSGCSDHGLREVDEGSP